jgi:hypothetical protein
MVGLRVKINGRKKLNLKFVNNWMLLQLYHLKIKFSITNSKITPYI